MSSRLLLLGLALAGIAPKQITISEDTRLTTNNAALGEVGQLTTVDPGVVYWASNGMVHAIRGDFDVYGECRISNTDFASTSNPTGMTSNYNRASTSGVWDGNVYTSPSGSFVVNDIASRSAPTFNWAVSTVENEGLIQWCLNGQGGGSTSIVQSTGAATSKR